jgi:putative inorganic carbon (HCO3(-)) transporter
MFTLAVILSYSRASWLGILAALGIFVLIKLKIKFKYIVFVFIIIVAFLASFWFQIIDRLEKNDQDSSSNLTHHISSITNIRTDASNVERLNRWYCAVEMFKEKPLTGYGPGTYQFQYAPFQLERMRTIISTNFGDVGNAHSEYLGPLAEQGIFGLLAFLILVITILQTGFKVYKKSNDREIKMLAISISLGFITYFLHGFLNNFLDTDKLAVPFFGFAAILVALDLYHSKTGEPNKSLNS